MAEYEWLVSEAYDMFHTSGIIANNGYQRYLHTLPIRHYVGLDSIQWLKPDAFSAELSFCRKWSNIERDKQGHATSMVWHLLLPGSAKLKRTQGSADCVGALEAHFNTEKLFAHLFKDALAKGIGVRLDAKGPNSSNPDDIFHEEPSLFIRGIEQNDNGPWVKETDFIVFTNRLHAVLSAPALFWNSVWPSLSLTLLGCLLSWAYYLRSRRGYERNLQKYGHHLIQQQRGEEVDFIAHEIVHELAQPLQGVFNCLEALMLRLNRNDLPPDILERDLSAAFQQTNRANTLLNKIRRQIGLADSSRLQSQPVATHDIFRSVVSLTKLDPRFHGISLVVKGGGADCHVLVSRAALEIVLLNLLRNSAEAIIETGKGGVISMEAKAEDRWVKLTVVDDGPGLSRPEDLFHSYRSSKPDGMGIGLVLCKSLLERFDGSITGGNRQEGGSWFEITLPACAEEVSVP